jgi:uncharacterized membrane protein YphA (DoxX/SURF4 family)
LPIHLCCFQQVATAALLRSSTPFGIPTIPFWMYVCALLLSVIGLVKISKELPQEHGVDKIMPFGRLFFAIPMAVFATEHFTDTVDIAALVPRWIPAHTFWVYLVGVGFLCAGFSIAVLVLARLAVALVGMTFVIFVLLMDVPGIFSHLGNRFFWALTLREPTFSCGAFAFAMSAWSSPPKHASPALPITKWIAFPRLFTGVASIFYGVEHLLHPDHVPGIPLEKVTPEWIPGRILLGYFVGVILILAGGCLLANKKPRMAATYLGLTILLTMMWVYLPMVVAAPKDVEALNYFFDTLLFCGAILLLANAMDKEPIVLRTENEPHLPAHN